MKSSLSTPENMPDNVARSIMGAHGEGNKHNCRFFGASIAVYSSRIPRANQDEQNPPPWQSTQISQQKQACEQHQ